MERLTSLLNTLFGLGFFFGLICAALLMLVAPKRAWRLLQQLAMAFVLWLLALFALCQLVALWEMLASTGNLGTLLLLGFVLSGVALLIYKIRHRQAKKPPELRGAERTPLLPTHLNAQPDHEGQAADGERTHV